MPDNFLSRLLNKLVDYGVIASGWWLIGLSFFTCVEVVCRKFFRFSLQGVDEVGAYTLAVTSALGFSYTLLTRGHVRIDFMLGRLPMKLRGALNVLAMVSLAAMAVFATWRGWYVLSESIEFQSTSTTPLQTPMWIPQSLWFLGYVLFAICACFLAVHALMLLFTHPEKVDRAYGPQTLEEEIEAETTGVTFNPDAVHAVHAVKEAA